ncbi:hypothetical protein NM688_g7831 [Phlebia brevispora]|uniref:Uncharacterized protein n=1 Tax=Phlebia brevispora TaxID=194682 RepID=A0ACC1S0U6_9APHY|nr:hypothetical protein NM688_g7831 [Phlebia brevispora]
MAQVAEVYAEQLNSLRLGHPLWSPEPVAAGDVQIGDVGLVEKGCFHRFFNVTVPPEHPWNSLGVPPGFVPVPIPEKFKHRNLDVLSAGLHGSESVTSTKVDGRNVCIDAIDQAGILYDFGCSGQSGAFIALNCTASSESVTKSMLALEGYMLQYHPSWHAFVTTQLGVRCGIEELVCVSGWVKTSGWTVAAFAKDSDSRDYAVQGQFAFSGRGGELQIIERRGMTVHYRSGPPRTTRNGPLPLGTASSTAELEGDAVPQDNDQALFVKYYKVKYRSSQAQKVIEAASGPRRLAEQDANTGRFNHPNGATKCRTDNNVEANPFHNKVKSPLDVLLDYLLEHSEAEAAVCSHDDLYNVLQPASVQDRESGSKRFAEPVDRTRGMRKWWPRRANKRRWRLSSRLLNACPSTPSPSMGWLIEVTICDRKNRIIIILILLFAITVFWAVGCLILMTIYEIPSTGRFWRFLFKHSRRGRSTESFDLRNGQFSTPSATTSATMPTFAVPRISSDTMSSSGGPREMDLGDGGNWQSQEGQRGEVK